MMYVGTLGLVAMAIASATPVNAQAPTTFNHPGIFTSTTRLNDLKVAANASGTNVRKTGYAVVTADPRSSDAYIHDALATVEVLSSGSGPTEERWKNDMQAAYLNTLRWVKTGNSSHKDKAISILNAWSSTFTGLTGATAQVHLEAAWVLPMVAQTGEILRHYGNSGWSANDIAKFSGYLDKLYAEASQASNRGSNQGASAGLAMMAAGVFQNNAGRYNDGYNTLLRLMPILIYSDGEVRELASRDCWHPQYSLTALVQGAEIASLQGDSSLWMFKTGNDTKPRLSNGLEYMAKAIKTGAGVRNCVGDRLRPGYPEIAINSYMNRGVAVPTLQSQTKVSGNRPFGSSSQFLGWDTATHGRDDF